MGNLLGVPGLRKRMLMMAMDGDDSIGDDEFATSVRTTRWADMPGPSRRSQTKERRGSSLQSLQPGTSGYTSHRASPSPTRKSLTFLKRTAFEYAPGLFVHHGQQRC